MFDELVDEVERLRAWKAEATEVLNGWHVLADEVCAALGKPVHLLGRSDVDVVRHALASELSYEQDPA